MADLPAKKACVIGWPVAHSLSPRLHGYWLKHYGIAGSYVALPVEPANLARELKELAEKGFAGGNLTIPHKEAALPLLDSLDDAARQIGAVNTIVIRDGKLHGSNTDAFGFIENIKSQVKIPKKDKAVLLGSGGAARAVCYALLKEGFAEIVIANRSEDKSQALAASFGKQVRAVAWEERTRVLAGADLLVNATSLGMRGKDPLAIDLSPLPKEAIVNDIVYVPLETPLLAAAKDRGNKTVDGLGMLLYQAVPGFEAWFGKKPEVTPGLRKALLEPAA